MIGAAKVLIGSALQAGRFLKRMPAGSRVGAKTHMVDHLRRGSVMSPPLRVQST